MARGLQKRLDRCGKGRERRGKCLKHLKCMRWLDDGCGLL